MKIAGENAYELSKGEGAAPIMEDLAWRLEKAYAAMAGTERVTLKVYFEMDPL